MTYPILAYHKISQQWELSFTMLYPCQFERQMRYLAKKGYIGKSLKEFLMDPQDNYFILTFDDAYENVYENAFPLLNELDYTATVFALSNFIGKENTWDLIPGNIYSRHMNAEQLGELCKNGWEIASHGRDHLDMTKMDPGELVLDLKESKEILEKITGEKVDTFCFPYGKYDTAVVEAAKAEGYKHLVGYTERSRLGVIKRSSVYRVVDNKYSVLRKIKLKPLGMFFEHIKEAFFHSFALFARLKQKLVDRSR